MWMGEGQELREACASVSSTALALCLPLLPREALCSLAVAHLWPLDSKNLAFSQEGQALTTGLEERMS